MSFFLYIGTAFGKANVIYFYFQSMNTDLQTKITSLFYPWKPTTNLPSWKKWWNTRIFITFKEILDRIQFSAVLRLSNCPEIICNILVTDALIKFFSLVYKSFSLEKLIIFSFCKRLPYNAITRVFSFRSSSTLLFMQVEWLITEVIVSCGNILKHFRNLVVKNWHLLIYVENTELFLNQVILHFV